MLLLVRALIKKPVNDWSLPSSDLASTSANAPKATALAVNLTCLVTPASTTSDSCSSTRLVAGIPAGVYRSLLTSTTRAVKLTWLIWRYLVGSINLCVLAWVIGRCQRIRLVGFYGLLHARRCASSKKGRFRLSS